MSKEILGGIRKLNWVLQESRGSGFSFSELCAIMSELMDANVYVVNVRGKLLGVHYVIEADSAALSDPETGVNKGQVLVVTHSPQVAALGQHHWRVEKHVSGGTTRSTVVPLAPAERVDEIARMLSGDQITDAARHAARALLAG